MTNKVKAFLCAVLFYLYVTQIIIIQKKKKLKNHPAFWDELKGAEW